MHDKRKVILKILKDLEITMVVCRGKKYRRFVISLLNVVGQAAFIKIHFYTFFVAQIGQTFMNILRTCTTLKTFIYIL